ncbi:S8 family serine peptidase [Ferrimonas pelagia]
MKQLTLATLTALYAASGVSAVAEPRTTERFESIVVTERVLELNERMRENEDRAGHTNALAANTNKLNVHRGVALTQDAKVPFVHEDGLTGEHVYIIELSERPVALYQGGVAGLSATAPRKSSVLGYLNFHDQNKIQTDSPAVQQYQSYLQQKQNDTLSQIAAVVGQSPQVVAQYQLAFNGMAVRMSQSEAAQVAQIPNVRAVQKDAVYQVHTDVGPQLIGADKIWNGLSSVPGEFRGEGMLVGIIDTGINSDHPSFAEVAGDGYVHTNPFGSGNYVGDCEQAEFASMCNDKLVGVRSYAVITDTYGDPIFGGSSSNPIRPANGEDYAGHGSHTAATAAGNVLYDVDFVVPELAQQSDGIPTGLKFPMISGVAPRANIIAYQACHGSDMSLGDQYAGCYGSALMSAIDDAIADGVDAINYSIGTYYGGFPWDHPIELAFLAAREAGINVSASAGNSFALGYGAIDHLSPWLTSVAATTHGREVVQIDKNITDMSGGDEAPPPTISGGGITDAYSGPIVLASMYGQDYESCNEAFPADFFSVDPEGNPWPGDVAPIVVCKRGDVARVTKAENIAAGGAGAMVLWNSKSSDNIARDAYVIPGINISYSEYWGTTENGRYGLEDWLDSGSGHMATITQGEVVTTQGQANYVANFSSRGPNLQAPDVMSPNLAAPGVDIFAAYADDLPFSAFPQPSDYAMISGTSMAAPHVAGAMTLLQQAHPDWTPAQIQSALMTTASLDGVASYGNPTAGLLEAGSGVINVGRAVDVGLLLDETGENYRAANPDLGGDVTRLNVPYMFNDNCAGTCSWMRTFTATKAGTYDLSIEVLPITGAPALELEVFPKQFTVEAGQTQSINVIASIQDLETIGADSSQIQLHGLVHIVPQGDDLPSVNLPVGARYQGDSLPKIVSTVVHRNQGEVLTPMMSTPEYLSLNTQVGGMTKATRHMFDLPRAERRAQELDPEGNPISMEELNADPGTEVLFFDVPAGTKRLVWSVREADVNGWPSLELGMDINEDGAVQWWDEAICQSYAAVGNYCAINDPLPGRYWAIAANWKFSYEDPENLADHFEVDLAIVSPDDEGHLTVTGPTSNDGLTPFHLAIDYDLPDMMAGDTYYGVIALGSDDYNQGNLGQFAFQLEHIGTDISIEADKVGGTVGDLVNYQVELAPNLLGDERTFELTTTLPDGFMLLEDSIVTGGNSDHSAGLSVEGNTIRISSTQMSSLEMPRSYTFTTNHDDPMCRVPYGDDPAFHDLFAMGQTPMGITGKANRPLYFSFAENDFPTIPLYGNPVKYQLDTLGIAPTGHIQLDPFWDMWNGAYEFADWFQGVPATVIAANWRGDLEMQPQYWDWNSSRWMNAVYGVITDEYYIFQWDGLTEVNGFLTGNDSPDPDAYYNFQSFIGLNLDFRPGRYEMVHAYHTMDSANSHLGSIGSHGYYGEFTAYGAALGYLNDGYAYRDLDTKAAPGTVVCADYHGPEESKVVLTFTARIGNDAANSDGELSVTSTVGNSIAQMDTHQIPVPGNIKLAEIADQQTEEGEALTGLSFFYSDKKGTTNGVEISGEHFTAIVHGTETGSTFDIEPEMYWNGTTEVTVTVYDMAYPTDRASTSFMLTVNSNGEAVVQVTEVTAEASLSGSDIMLSAEAEMSGTEGAENITLSWSQTSGPTVAIDGSMVRNAPAGDYVFTATYAGNGNSMSANAEVTVAEVTQEKKSSSSGSLSYLALLMLTLFGARRRQG